MVEFALGTMGMSQQDFFEITPYYFDLKCKGFSRLQDDDEENFRKLGWIVFAMNADQKSVKRTSIDDIWPTKANAHKQKQQKGLTKNIVANMMKNFRTLKQ